MNTQCIRILLIEDDLIDQKALQRFIHREKLPYECKIAKSVTETVEILKENQFDILLMDYVLGDGTAFDLFKYVANIPIIVVTGAGNEEVAVQAMKAGAYDYIIKDHHRNYLKVLPVTIENAMKRRKFEAQTELLSFALRSVNDSVYITGMDDRIVFVNTAFCYLYGYEHEEIVGKKSEILWKDPEENEDVRNMVSKAVDVEWRGEVLHKSRDKHVFPISLSISMIKDNDAHRCAVIAVGRDIAEQKSAEEERERLIFHLQQSLDKVSTLGGLLPICTSCKKVRDDKGYWRKIEEYISRHSGADISHSLCPECAKRYYNNKEEDEK